MPSPTSAHGARFAYSPAEAAELLSCSRKTIYAWMSQGLLHSTKIGGSRRIPHTEIERVAGVTPQPAAGDAA